MTESHERCPIATCKRSLIRRVAGWWCPWCRGWLTEYASGKDYESGTIYRRRLDQGPLG